MTKTTDEKVDDLARMVAEGFTDLQGEIADVRTTIATKSDLADLEQRMAIEMDRHLGAVRADYDSLAGRVKNLESAR
ncbi:MAG TPA: hypothetical protein VHC20_07895 [Candidatus Paceibacterota bacterium]|nr:hypothetical protein [Candidatus Paceibacterota bacterium]